MDDKDVNSRKLWEYLREIQNSYQFDSLYIDFSGFKPTSIKEILTIFDSIDISHKKKIADSYGMSVDKFRSLIESGWQELQKDKKYPYVSEYERGFYQLVDPIIEDIKEAAQELKLAPETNFIFGSLPSKEINAIAIEAPNNLGYIIGVNFGTMIFIDSIGQLFDSFYVKVANHLQKITADIEGESVNQLIRESIDEDTNRLFVDLVISYFYLGIPGFAFTQPPLQEALFNPSGISSNNNFSKLVIPFILCHEYAHFSTQAQEFDALLAEHHQGLFSQDQVDIINELKHRRNAVSEITADNLGLQLLIQVSQKYYGMPEPNSSLLIAALGRAYSGMSICLCCIEILEKVKSILEGKTYDELYDKNSTHLPALVRRKWLEGRWINQLKDLGYPVSLIAVSGKIFERFIEHLWENNKRRIEHLFIEAKRADG